MCADDCLASKIQEEYLSWDTAIADAKEQIKQQQANIEILLRSISFFERQKRQGIPFPGRAMDD